MESTFHEFEWRPRTVIRARAAAGDRAAETEADRDRVIGSLLRALNSFPEARAAVIAALEESERHGDGVE